MEAYLILTYILALIAMMGVSKTVRYIRTGETRKKISKMIVISVSFVIAAAISGYLTTITPKLKPMGIVPPASYTDTTMVDDDIVIE